MSCRDTFGLFEANSFKFWTCSMCYYYLFPKNTELRPNWPSYSLISLNGTVFPQGMEVVPDIDNVTSLDLVCRTLSGDSCRRWTTCCEDAWKCCVKQQTNMGLSEGNDYCPHTWDGFACWDNTPSGHRVHTSCPEYVEHFNPSSK